MIVLFRARYQVTELRRTVLLVDNDDGFLRAVTTRLEHEGFRVLTATTGAQALGVYRDGNVDAIITDLNMPSGDGVTLAKSIRAVGDEPIVVVTGFEAVFQTELLDILGVEVLQKPFEFERLLEVLNSEIGIASRDL